MNYNELQRLILHFCKTNTHPENGVGYGMGKELDTLSHWRSRRDSSLFFNPVDLNKMFGHVSFTYSFSCLTIC
jgi:hypothetical protein